MSNSNNIVNILKSVGLNESYYFKMSIYDPVFAQWKYKEPKYWNQFGGAKIKKIISGDIEYKFYKRHDYGEIIYTLHSKDNDTLNCITNIINIKLKTAYIHELGNNKGCIIIGYIKENGGSILMEAALKLINKIKNKYKLEYVYLTDNANKTIYDDNNEPFNINLSNLLFFTKGKTYYEKFGFIPIESDINGKNRISNSLINKYKEKKKILQKRIIELKINFDEINESVKIKYHNLIDNIKNNKNHNKLNKASIYTFLKYYINKKEYIPIIG